MKRSIPYICPRCQGRVVDAGQEYHCLRCSHRYPVVLGIPDFRVFPDPYIAVEEDYRKGRALAAIADGVDFRNLVAEYWQMTPGAPAVLVAEYVRAVVDSHDRARAVWQGARGGGGTRDAVLLDVGCGAGGLLSTAAADLAEAIGVDIAFRWLVVARKRLQELGIENARLVCACAEALPFPEDSFDLVTADDVLDHTREPDLFVREGARVLRRGGTFFLTTPNRFSLGPDPHVWVWGVGYLPRRLRDRYVRWRRGIPFGPIHPVSYLGLRRLLAGGGLAYRITVAPVSDAARRGLPPWQAALARLYNTMSRVPGIRSMLLYVGLVLHAWCRKVPAGERSTVARTAR